MAISDKAKLTWDAERQLYVYGNGRVVAWKDVRRWIDETVKVSGSRLYDLGVQVQEGRISISRWQMLAAKEIKNLHTASFVVAQGGKNQMGFTGYARLGDVIHFQLEHLRDFAKSMPAVDERDGRIPPRLESYASAAIGTYENNVLDRNIDFGLSIARRVTAYRSESCDDCLAEEDIGWQDIKQIKRIGDTPCGPRCNCYIEFEEVTPGQITLHG